MAIGILSTMFFKQFQPSQINNLRLKKLTFYEFCGKS